MKRLIFKLGGVILAILLAMPTYAQSKLRFSVVGFEQDLTDLSAQSAQYKKVDGSGSLYAIVKVRSNNPDDDLREYQFNFGNLKHIVEERDGELWLYVQRNAKTVTITRRGYAPIQRYDLRTTIQPGRNYVMQLSAASRPTYKQMVKFSVTPAGAKAVVMVKSAKDGAVEELFGIADGSTGEVAKSLELGSYTYRVISAGNNTVEGRFLLTDRTAILSEKVRLNSKPRATVHANDSSLVRFTVTPAASNAVLLVKRDDSDVEELFGIANAKTGVASRQLAPGKYSYSIISHEYESAEGSFVVQPRQRGAYEQGVTLKPNFSTITLKVSADADIYIDNAKKGTRTWTGKLNAGTYYVECRQANMKNSAQYIRVEKNNNRTIVLDSPTPITGTLAVSSNPLGAQVTIDGIESGETPQNIDLIIGHHTVALSKPNYRTETVDVDIAENLTTELSLSLVNYAKITINSTPASASLSIDGKNVGSTPFSQEMVSGDYLLRLTAPKHSTFEKRIHLDSSTPTINVRLDRQYQQPTAVYAQVGAQVGTMMGVGAAVGGYFRNINVEASATMGLAKESIYLNSINGSEPRLEEVKPMCFGGRVGYGIIIGTRIRLTPQVGASVLSVKDNEISTHAICATAGLRFEYAIADHFGVSATGEGCFAVSKHSVFEQIAAVSSKIKGWGTGGNLRIGAYISF